VFFHISILKDGYKGVDLFFVISGFVIYSSSKHKIGSGLGNALFFLLKRVVRIFVPYWSILLLIFLTGYYHIIIGNAVFEEQLKSIFLLPGHNPFFEVSWSLSFELYFYFLFSLFIFIPFSRKAVKWIFITAITLITILLLLRTTNYITTGKAVNFLAGSNIWEFLLGIAAALACTRILQKVTPVVLVLFITAIVVFACIYIPYGNHESQIVYGPSAFVIVLIITRLEELKRMNINRAFVILGDASYITYLVHVPLREIFFTHRQVSLLNKIIYIAITYIASVLIHLVYEKKVLSKLNDQLYRLFYKPVLLRKK